MPGASRRVSLERTHYMQRLHVVKMSYVSNESAPLFPDDVLPPEGDYESQDSLIKCVGREEGLEGDLRKSEAESGRLHTYAIGLAILLIY
jgi:hypothetical protein